jgi:hypothetical protein
MTNQELTKLINELTIDNIDYIADQVEEELKIIIDTFTINETLHLQEPKKSRYTESQKRAIYKYQKKHSKELYQKNKGRVEKWLENNDSNIKEYMSEYYEANKEKYKLRSKEAYEKRKEEVNKYYETNKEKYKLRSKEAYQKKKDKEALLNKL